MRRGSNLLLGESARLSLMPWTLSYLTAASYSYTILLFAVSSFFKFYAWRFTPKKCRLSSFITSTEDACVKREPSAHAQVHVRGRFQFSPLDDGSKLIMASTGELQTGIASTYTA